MVKLEVNTTNYLTKEKEPVIYLSCRDANKKRYLLSVYGFKPYFYTEPFALSQSLQGIRNIEKGYKLYNSNDIVKVTTTSPKDVSRLKRKVSNSWESSILFPNKFLIDLGINRGIKIDDNVNLSKPIHYTKIKPTNFTSKLNVCHLDIEIVAPYDDFKNNIQKDIKEVVKDADYIISHISFVESYTNRRFVLEFNPEYKEFDYNPTITKVTNKTSEKKFYNKNWVKFDLSRSKNIIHITFKYEEDMLKYFTKLFNKLDFDVLQAYNLDNFDYPYIINRLDKLNINKNKMSKLGIVNPYTIYGIELIDTYKMLKKLLAKEIPNYTLDYVSKEFLPERQKIDIRRNISDDLKQIIQSKTNSNSIPSNLITWIFYYGNNKDKRLLTCYNLEDSVVISKLDEKKRLLQSRKMLAQTLGTHMSQTFGNVGFVYNYLLKFSKDKFVLPNLKYEDRKAFEGAEVLDPFYGVLKNVAILDLSRLYPEIICAYNIGFETRDDKNGDINVGNGIKFSSKTKSIFFNAFQKLFKQREIIQKKMLLAKPDSDEYKLLDDEQFSIKQLINSFYGVLDFFDSDLAACVTFVGRKIVLYTKYLIEKYTQYKVIYGDTDSVFVYVGDSKSKDEVINIGYELEKLLNKAYDVLIKKDGIKEHNIITKFEQFGTFAQVATKKRYAMKIEWDMSWNDINRVDYKFKGLQIKRSDYSEMTKEVQEFIWKGLLNQIPNDEIVKFIKNKVNVVKNENLDLIDISTPVRISKELNQYKGSYANNIKVRAAKNSKKIGINIGVGGKYYMININKLKINNPWELLLERKYEGNGILFSDESELNELLKYCKIDRDLIIEKQIRSSVVDILNMLGISWNDIITNGKQRTRKIQR